jgi:chemotaxis protein MotB
LIPNKYNNLLSNSGKLGQDLAKQQKDLLAAENNLELIRVENEKLSADLKKREIRVKELETILAKKDSAVNSLKNAVSKALLSFKESDLTINVKNGKVYVSLAEQLLFKSGSISVDPKGQNALKQLATVLKSQKDINVMVEGHTDDVPVSKSSEYMNDNWDLSVMRATAITRILTNNGVDPKKITAAGKGENYPLETAKTAEARQKNRRTEIILTPKLDELFRILEGS